jgi:hypothetical protein
VFDLLDGSGDTILPDGAVDDSFDSEYIRLVPVDADGLFSVQVSGFEGASGAYELRVDQALGETADTAVVFNAALEAGSSATVSFTADAGDVVRLFVDPEFGMDVSIEVYDASSGELLDEADNTTGFEELVFNVSDAAAYYFQINALDSGGDYVAGVLAPETTTVVIAADATVYGRFRGGDPLTYALSGSSGQSVSVVVTPDEGTDATARLSSAAGAELASVDDAFSGEAETLSYTFDADGEVTLEVSDFFFGQGRFVMTLDFD